MPRVSATKVTDNSTSLLPAAALGHPAAQSSLFPVTQAPSSRDISIQTEEGKTSGPSPPVFSRS